MSNNSGSRQSSESTRNLENLREIASSLREKSDFLEDELGTLKAEQLAWYVERRRLERELEVKDDTLKDLTRDLSLSKEAEAKAIKRYDRALEYNREVEEKMDELRKKFDDEKEEFLGKLSVLKGALMEKEEELEGLRRRNKVLVSERGKLEALKEELGFKLRGKEGEVCDLLKKCVELEAELKELKNMKVRDEELGKEGAKLEELIRKNEDLQSGRDEIVDDLLSRIEVLENELLEMVTKKNGEIGELMKEKEGLEREKREMVVKYKMMEESFVKLEGDVATHLCLRAKRDDKFGCSQIGKILSMIMNALDAEQEQGVNVKGEVKVEMDLEADPAFVSHANNMKCSLVTKSEEAAKTIVISEEEHFGVNGAACNQKSQSPAYIQISDSDDDESRASGLKRERASSVCSIQMHSDGISSDDSLNPKRKIKKLEHVLGEPAKHGQPIASSDCRSDHKFSTPHKQKVTAIRECKENLSRKMKTPGLEGNDCKDVSTLSRSKKTDVLEYMAKCQKKLEKNVLECVADMALACEKDSEFCAKAVCTLYRNGLLCSGQRGFEKYDIDRATALAEYLIDGDPNSDKKSADESKQQDPGWLDTCRKLARGYSDKLFEIFKSSKDPLFSHLSSDMQYR